MEGREGIAEVGSRIPLRDIIRHLPDVPSGGEDTALSPEHDRPYFRVRRQSIDRIDEPVGQLEAESVQPAAAVERDPSDALANLKLHICQSAVLRRAYLPIGVPLFVSSSSIFMAL